MTLEGAFRPIESAIPPLFVTSAMENTLEAVRTEGLMRQPAKDSGFWLLATNENKILVMFRTTG